MSPSRPVAPRSAGRFSRRHLLALAALAAATPLGAGLRPGPAGAGSGGEGDDDAYQRAFQQLLAADPEVRLHGETGREFLYRPRQLLVADPDAQRVLAALRKAGHQATPGGRFAGVTRLRFDRETEVPAVVAKLRDPRQWPEQPVPRVQPHHLLVGYGNIMGNPGGPPQVAAALPAPDPAHARDGAGVTVGVCDTGVWRLADSRHPLWLGGSYLPQVDDEDPLYLHTDVLGPQGGHGTFVAGVVRQAAPGVSFDPEPALHPTGIGDEEMLVAALAALDPQVSIVNLSLGCFTQDDLPPLPLANVLGGRRQGSVVVASAGNAGTSRPTWPAALPEVLAVAAVSRDAAGLAPAPYSNHGSWVDVCAVGERTSTFVDGRLLLPGLPARQFLGYASWAGTSFAAAHVSGRLAAVMTGNGLDAEQARQFLLAQPVWHPDYGVLVD
ncbi:S8 family serine peptidase [Micromonospora sp. WMMD1102]|uniref:S8 family peptidase n=1 Tax=Micromonospora sp. WMMD1102 TaxID=3016105 RepID=UPI002414EF37|nr:S8 family serine peptidase [Micromonospora sp. WMMD1102]MDG4789198.1 S8 family serine peptidase [Micromonospora sp. WMMD1102]